MRDSWSQQELEVLEPYVTEVEENSTTVGAVLLAAGMHLPTRTLDSIRSQLWRMRQALRLVLLRTADEVYQEEQDTKGGYDNDA